MTETDGTAGGGNQRLREAERVLQELRTRYTDQSPDVISQRPLIAAIRSGGATSRTRAGRKGFSGAAQPHGVEPGVRKP